MINRRLLGRMLFFLLCLLWSQGTFAQANRWFQPQSLEIREGIDLFEAKQYAASSVHFNRWIKHREHIVQQEGNGDLPIAHYFLAFCAAESGNDDAVNQLDRVVKQYPTHFLKDKAFYYWLRHEFKARKWDAVIAFPPISEEVLDAIQSEQLKIMKGVALVQKGKFKDGLNILEQIRNPQSELEEMANYYTGYASFKLERYSKVPEFLNKVVNSKHYGLNASLLLAQLYFLQKDYDKAIQATLPGADRKDQKQRELFALVTAQAYYMKQDFEKAWTYFKIYLEKTSKPGDVEAYQAGFSAWKVKQTKEAISLLNRFFTKQDSTSQMAHYLVGESYLVTQEKDKAQKSFELASELNFNKNIKELSAYNSARLLQELGLQAQALQALQQFVQMFPKSKYNDDVRNMTGKLLLSSRNFRQAVEVLDSVEDKSVENRKVFQQVTYFRGIELFNESDFIQALQFFRKSLEHPYDDKIKSMAAFWAGESAFKSGKLSEALALHKTFLESNPRQDLPLNVSELSSRYTLGYVHYSSKNYSSALKEWEAGYELFQKSSLRYNQNDDYKILIPDMFARTADAAFAVADYPKALLFYDRVINRSSPGTDYALYQKATIHGLRAENDRKIELLKRLITLFPQSAYSDNAYMDLANTYVSLDKPQEALVQLDKLISSRPNSNYIRKAYNLKGLIYYNSDQDDLALDSYRKTVTSSPKSPEARDAIAGIKAIYIAKNEVDQFYDFLKTVPSVSFSTSEVDSVSFESAMKVAQSGDCTKSIKELSKYLTKFPDGYFSLQAHQLRGECYEKSKDTLKAIADYGYVSAQPVSGFTEKSLIKQMQLKRGVKDSLGSIEAAERILQLSESKAAQLEATLCLMELHFGLNQKVKAQQFAVKVLSFDIANTEAKQSAALILGQLALENGDFAQAMVEFTKVYEAQKNVKAAQARYLMAKTHFMRKEWSAAQTIIFDLAAKMPYHDNWVARGFVLLARVYHAQGNNPQALATLNSVIENHDGPEVVAEAKALADQIKKSAVQQQEEEQ